MRFLCLSGDSRATSSSAISWPSARSWVTAASMERGRPEHERVQDQAERAEMLLPSAAMRMYAALEARKSGIVKLLPSGDDC
ncbi:hypothetical protein AS200_44620 (plasmid) [Streptomyces sp. CdTB01]|nr:hypothetical protein AS200_44620 [Streptomyces sp. CdTB01]